MKSIKKYQFLLSALIGVATSLYTDYLLHHKFNISIITIIFGFAPLTIQFFKMMNKQKLAK